MSIGPGSDTAFVLTAGLSSMLLRHSAYLASLTNFEKYVIWRYTMGSGTLNAVLLGFATDVQVRYFVYTFITWYNVEQYGILSLPEWMEVGVKSERRRNELLRNAVKCMSFVKLVIALVSKIIHRAPKLEFDIVVYKASSDYPGIPHEDPIVDVVNVEQKPFNSTTYDPQFSFGLFTAEKSEWALWKITIPAGSSVLSINPTYHAYPFEREVLLPPGVLFQVYKTEIVVLDTITKEGMQYEVSQRKALKIANAPNFVIGEVFRPKPGYAPEIVRKKMHLLSAVLVQQIRMK